MTDFEDHILRTDQHSYPLTGHVYYRPRRHLSNRPPSLPVPPIRPRTRRPQSIHIVSYPSGYIPPELRPANYPKPKRSFRADKEHARGDRQPKSPKSKNSKRAIFDRVFAPIKEHFSHYVANDSAPARSETPSGRPSTSSCHRTSRIQPEVSTRPMSMISVPSIAASGMPPSTMVDNRRGGPLLNTALQNSHRGSLMSMRSAKSIMSSVTEVPKPVASGSGVSCSIVLAEPNVFLTGFEHDGHPRHETANSTALLRGKLQLDVTKNVKLKSVTLKLVGKARTEWPEGIPL
ncbi:hypothetical protein PG990_004327 [Apiospora arundinis]